MEKIRFRRRPLILILTIILIISVIYVLSKISHLKSNCDSKIVINENFMKIPQKLLTNGTIYFLETHNSVNHQLTAREACAIESAALTNPNENIVVLFLSPTNYAILDNWVQFKEIFNYKNVHLVYFNMHDIVKDTIIEEWMESGALDSSKYVIAHTSDILRIVLLHKYSGIYLDLDVITIKSIKELDYKNFACFNADGGLINNGIMKMSGENGKKFGKIILQDVMDNYDGSRWEINGPILLTNTLKKFCDVPELTNITECKDFHILSKNTCYAVGWYEWFKLFKEHYADEAMRKIKGSYFVHLWNSTSKGREISKFIDTALNRLAAEYCPRVYESEINEI